MMKVEATQAPVGHPTRVAPFSLAPFVVMGLLGLPSAAAGQNPQLPSPAQTQQMLQQNPALIQQLRDRLQSSGLSAEQIRARLAASGYAPDLLDAYLGPAQPGQAAPTPGAQQLAAMQALGLGTLGLAAESLRVDTGVVKMRSALRAESLAVGNYVFGMDVFRRATTQFLPLLAGPVPPDYRLGPGDNLVLIITGEIELAYTLPVTREGFVLIPQVGQVFVSNLTLDQLRDVLYARLGPVYSGVKRGPRATTRFDVSVASVRANQTYVVGEVEQPGAYRISSLGTVLTALYAAGGLTDRGNMRAVQVRRNTQLVTTFDLYDYLLRGDTRSDVRLETGDVIFVPIHGTRVQITGGVRRPAIYELKAGEVLVDVIRAAGGFRPDAQLDRLTVYRLRAHRDRGPGAPPRAALDLSLAHQGAPPGGPTDGVTIPELTLQDGDSVVVDTVRSLEGQYYVALAGRVRKPGMYPWHAGMTLRDLVLLGRGPTVGAYLKEAEIARLPEDRSKGQLARTIRVPLDSTYLVNRDSAGQYFGPPGIGVAASGAPEVPLLAYDNVLILREPDFELQRTVDIMGEVRFPGTYALTSKAERLVDLIARSGGLTPEAYAEGVRFNRALNDVGRINVDIPGALRNPASALNIVLQPGDSLLIPEYEPSVKVAGAVNSPGSVLWKKGRDLEYYLGAAGGFSYKADKGRVSIKYANGEVRTRRRSLFSTSNPKPGPGSEVFVPVRDTTHVTNWVSIASAVAGILSSTLAIVVLAKQL